MKQKKPLRPIWNRALSLTLAGVMTLGTFAGVAPMAKAQQVPGNAPFINSWLVSGPFAESVTDSVYGEQGDVPVERPADGNWAKLAKATATSSWQTGPIDFPGDSPTSQTPDKAIDGDMATEWISQMHDAAGDPSGWPVWDPAPTLTLEWKSPISVKTVQFYDRFESAWGGVDNGVSDLQKVEVSLFDKDGNQLGETVTVTDIDPNAAAPGVADFGEEIADVVRAELKIIHDGDKYNRKNIGLGMKEVQVYDAEGPGISDPRPSDGNWAKRAAVSASSEWSGGYSAAMAVDGDYVSYWSSNSGRDGANDPEPTFHMDWEYPIEVQKINFYDNNWGGDGVSDTEKLICLLKDENGDVIAEQTVTEGIDITGKTASVVEFSKPVQGVRHAELHIVYNADEWKESKNYCLGFTEVEVLDSKGAGADAEFGVNIAPKAAVSVSTNYSDANPPEYLVDGTPRRQWVTKDNDMEPWAMLTWENPVTFNEVDLFQWGDGRHVNEWYDLTITFADGTTQEAHVDATGSTSDEAATWSYDGYLKNVKSIKVEVDKGRDPYPSITGISEMEVYCRNVDEADVPPYEKPEVEVFPALGEGFGDETETHSWEYFDDRIYNRNYDDYQDLSGYYTTKKGVDTKNKFVYAHTYVYSPKDQWAQVRVGTSGSYTVYVNDVMAVSDTEPVEVQKDLSCLDVVLRQGWNKILIEMEHTFTEDTNSNGVPIAKDQNVSYLGFYGRVTDAKGNALDGVFTSVMGGQSEELEIVSQGVSSEEMGEDGLGLPEGNMPVAYKEWPYVWNKSTTGNKYGLSASAFKFQAAGGTAPYTWEVVGGMPEALNLNLLPDGTIEDGLNASGKPDLNSTKAIIPMDCPEGDYTFTVKVTDAEGKTAEKDFTITVKERPNKWFEEGRVGALSHCIAVPSNFVDPNFSYDSWAERAKRQGHSLVSMEALQQNYYWPSKFADPKHDRNQYFLDENGVVRDGLKAAADSVKRYGMKFGLYYATEGGGLQHFSTDVFVQNVADLIVRYEPEYLYFDGPQSMRSANYDVMYSNVRNYSNDIIINSNAWGEEFGDPDLGTHESSGIYANGCNGNHFVKKVTFEPWKSVHTKHNPTPYYARRDDYRQISKEMVMNAARGYVDNNDQMPIMMRGSNWDAPSDIANRYPKALQEFIDVREGLTSWFAPEGSSERHESTTGTTPFFMPDYDTCACVDNGRGNYKHFADGHGPAWGYATYRDNNYYMHILSGPDGRRGFGAIQNNTIEVGPFEDTVTSVIWLNEDKVLDKADYVQEGTKLTIHLDNVTEDPVDTIIKVVTNSEARKYQLTNLYLEGKQLSDSELQIVTQGYMTYPALRANLENVTYSSDNDAVAVSADGVATPVSNGTATVTVTGTYEGVTVSNTLKVTAKDGKIYVGEEMGSAVLHVNDREVYGELYSNDEAVLNIEGRALIGGPIDLSTADITWHTGTVDLTAGTKAVPIAITENEDAIAVENGKLVLKPVEATTRAVVWADVTLDGVTKTTNRVYLDLLPYGNLSQYAEITASVNNDMTANLADGKAIDGINVDNSKWTAPAGMESTVEFTFAGKQTISGLNVDFNTLDQRYYNTPAAFTVQTSEDGETWTDVATFNGKTGSAWFGFYDSYDFAEIETAHLRLVFNQANGSAIDLLEVAVKGVVVLSDATAQEVADELVLENPAKGEEMLKKPLVPAGFKVAIESVKPEGTIDTDWSIQIPDVDTQVEVTLLVTKISDGTTAKAVRTVTVPAVTPAELLDQLVIPQPGKEAEKLDLPTVPKGYEIRIIKSSHPQFIDLEGNITTPPYDVNVTLTIEISHGETKAQKDFVVSLIGNTEVKDVTVGGVGSEETEAENNSAAMAFDGKENTFWHSLWDGGDIEDQWITAKLPEVTMVNGLRCLPRQSGNNGYITKYEIYVSMDNVEFTKVTEGSWTYEDAGWKEASFEPVEAQYVKLKVVEGRGGFASAAEIRVTAFVEPPVEADKTALEEAVKAAEAITNDNYTEESWTAFQTALTEAKAVLDKAEATQEEIDAAKAALEAAIAGLAEKPVVKEETIVVRAVVNGDKSTAKTIFTGKAPHGANLIEWLNTNVDVEDRTGYEADTWYNWDWFGHKHNDKATITGWTNVYVNYNKLERVIVKAVVDGNKDTAEVIWTGYAKKGVNLVEFLNENVKVEDREGYTVDKWYNWDWFGHKHSEKTTVNGWTNVYVTYNKIPMVNVVAKAVENGDKSTAKTIWSGKAPKGANLVEWLTANVKVDVAEGFTWDNTWMNWDWFGHKHNDKATFNGWTNVYVNFTNK